MLATAGVPVTATDEGMDCVQHHKLIWPGGFHLHRISTLLLPASFKNKWKNKKNRKHNYSELNLIKIYTFCRIY
jgi:hypothetical protein